MKATKFLFTAVCLMIHVTLFGQSTDDDDSPVTFTIVEEMPAFPGCGSYSGKERQDCSIEKVFRFLTDHLEYPEDARKKEIQGVVYVNFVIDEEGRVTEAKILRGVTESLDQEALRVVNLLPQWHPGTQRGKAVRVSYNLPLRFSIPEKKKNKKKKKD